MELKLKEICSQKELSLTGIWSYLTWKYLLSLIHKNFKEC